MCIRNTFLYSNLIQTPGTYPIRLKVNSWLILRFPREEIQNILWCPKKVGKSNICSLVILDQDILEVLMHLLLCYAQLPGIQVEAGPPGALSPPLHLAQHP